MRPAFLAALLALAWSIPGVGCAQDDPTTGIIRGHVVDDLNETGLSGARVLLLDDARRVLRAATADDSGYFVLARLRPGPFQLRVARLGYVETTTPTWWVEGGDVMDVVVRVRPDAIAIAPLEVVALSRRRVPVLGGFYRRMQDAPVGLFLNREQIEKRHATRVTDLLADLPGVRLERPSGYSNRSRSVVLGRALLSAAGGRCPVQVFVDGILASRRGEAVPLDDLAAPSDLEGIEVYRGLSSVPPEFLTPEARCGVIALWTRRGRNDS